MPEGRMQRPSYYFRRNHSQGREMKVNLSADWRAAMNKVFSEDSCSSSGGQASYC